MIFEERRVSRIVAWYLKQFGVNSDAIEHSERELGRWETELTARRERILDALAYGKIDSAETFRQIGGEIWKRFDDGPRSGRLLLGRLIRRVIVSPTGSSKA